MKRARVPILSACLLTLGGASCSDPAPPPAQGGATLSITHPASGVCDRTLTTPAQIGNPGPTSDKPGQRLVDGTNGAFVTCRVVAGGEGFTFDGEISWQGNRLTIVDGTMGADLMGSAGFLSVLTPLALGLQSSRAMPCTINASVRPLEIAPGRIWATYDCPEMIDTKSPATRCASNGVFVFENCAK
jgi:hypothetical protein